MLQLIGWRLRQMVRDVPMMFWGLAFPIIMGILFQVSFGNGSDEENMSVIPIALVSRKIPIHSLKNSVRCWTETP